MTQSGNQGDTQQRNGTPDNPQVKPPVITPDPVTQGRETKDDKRHDVEQRVSKS